MLEKGADTRGTSVAERAGVNSKGDPETRPPSTRISDPKVTYTVHCVH